MQVRFRPISTWPGERTGSRTWSRFKASWPATLNLLERELEHLQARDVVIEVALREDQIRIDGWPRAGATPTHPGVVVSFDSKYGPLRYATDVFHHHEANVRAIALGLEALRKVDRYGITRRGEQYTGWKALPSSTIALDAGGPSTKQEAAKIIADGARCSWETVLDNEIEARLAYRAAVKRLHPDTGGDAESFRRLQKAKELLGV